MVDWLRPILSRAKTPTFSLDSSSSQVSPLANASDGRLGPFHLRPGSKSSAYMKYGESSNSQSSSSTWGNLSASVPAIIYQEPSVDQQVETLKVVMMTKNTMDPIPVKYNSCISYTLEEYQNMRRLLNEKEREIDELKKNIHEATRHHEDQESKWEAREEELRIRISHLETITSETKTGDKKVFDNSCESTIDPKQNLSDLYPEINEFRSTSDADNKTRTENIHDVTKWITYPPTLSNMNCVMHTEPKAAKKPGVEMISDMYSENGITREQVVEPYRNKTHSDKSPDSTHRTVKETERDPSYNTKIGDIAAVGRAGGIKIMNNKEELGAKVEDKNLRHPDHLKKEEIPIKNSPGHGTTIKKISPRRALDWRSQAPVIRTKPSLSSDKNMRGLLLPPKKSTTKKSISNLEVSDTLSQSNHRPNGYGFLGRSKAKQTVISGSEALVAATAAVAASHKTKD